MDIIKKHLSLIIGLSIPVLMVIIVAASVYLPYLFVKIEDNFLYSVDSSSYYSRYYYDVTDGRIQRQERMIDEDEMSYIDEDEAVIYLYDFKTNTSRELSYEEATKISLSDRKESPNGYTITQGSSSGGMWPVYYSDDNDSFYITGNGVSKKLDIDAEYYEYDFLGWVK